MRFIAGILSGLTGLYSILITVRILITWFSRGDYGKPYELLCRITDPYLHWFRRFPVFRTPTLDLSPIAAMAALSLLNNVFRFLAIQGRISAGLIAGMLLQAVWSAAAFLLGFFMVALVLRLVSLYLRLGGIFWNVIDGLTRPLLYRIERLFFRSRLVNYQTSIFLSLGALGAAFFLGNGLVKILFSLLVRLPF
jgi:YggT family protein